MKSTITILLFLLSFSLAKAQRLTSYEASNGITYHIKDTVRLGLGSAPNGTFLYLQVGGWAAIASYSASNGPNANNIGRGYANTAVIVKKINQTKIKGVIKTYFTVGGGNITNYMLYIDDAIQVCEVVPCQSNNNNATIIQQAAPADNLDKLKKLKGLLDSGAITQAEYDEQKKKLLSQ